MTTTIQKLHLENLVSVEALSNKEVMSLIKRAGEFKKGAVYAPPEQKYAVNLFF